MSAQLLSQEGTQVRIEVTIDLSHSLLTSEEAIQESLNEAGRTRHYSRSWVSGHRRFSH